MIQFNGKLGFVIFALTATCTVQAVDYVDAIEGILNPLLTSGSGWNVQAGMDGTGASVNVVDRSPLDGSTMSIRQMGGSVTSTTQRIWKNFLVGSSPVTINSGVYIWEWDFRAVRANSTNSYVLRNRLEGLNNNFNEQIATVGLAVNPTDGVNTYSGVHPMLADYPGGGTLEYQFFATTIDPTKWYRCISYIDFDSGVHNGPTIIDISTGTANNYVMMGNAVGSFNPNPAGGFFSNAQCSTFGAGSGCPTNEGWNVDNQRLTQGRRVAGSVTLQGITRVLDLGEEAVNLLFVGSNGSLTSSPLVPTFVNGQGTFQVVAKQGTYTVYAFGGGFLSKRLATNLVINNDLTLPAFTLTNGDVDDDDVVSIFDYIALSDAFDSSLTGGVGGNPSNNWNKRADLDRDGVVSVFDYIILSDNFDSAGEYPG